MITTHVLDTSRGKVGAGIRVTLEKEAGAGRWEKLADAVTDADGRVKTWPGEPAIGPGIYRLTFSTRDYYKAAGTSTLYPFVNVTFDLVRDVKHLHIPLLLNPFGYTTYRGS